MRPLSLGRELGGTAGESQGKLIIYAEPIDYYPDGSMTACDRSRLVSISIGVDLDWFVEVYIQLK